MASTADQAVPHPLRIKDRPGFETGDRSLRLVDLYAGCGGLTLGAAQAARDAGAVLDVRLAVDSHQTAVDVYLDNFPRANAHATPVETFFDGPLGGAITAAEQKVKTRCGEVGLLFGGPPCQGHSDLNNHTRRNDPKNALYARMARAAAVLVPKAVMIENVPAVQHDKGKAVAVTRAALTDLAYAVADKVVHFRPLGVAQTRKRHVLLAIAADGPDPERLLDELGGRPEDQGAHLAWAIGDLGLIKNGTGYDRPPKASPDNVKRMEYLLRSGKTDLPNSRRPPCHQDDGHSYVSMYGRLSWHLPAQTITSGFGSIGQGRYMHPDLPRALTAHEAARLQGFPDYFRFDKAPLRGDLATIIGNAVPPALGREIATALLPHILSPPADVPAAVPKAADPRVPASHGRSRTAVPA